MRHQIKSTIVINATPQEVWRVFTDFNAYPQWNPFIKSIRGNIVVGEKFNAEIGTMKFRPTTKVFEENKEFTWQGQLFFPGIFDGRHSFVFTDNGNGTTTLIHKEDFSGILIPFTKKKLDTDIRQGFKSMNEKLKALVEQGTS
ncbi:MAG: SRPBCC domain-containing protein [Bacteroidota bacterium]